ncbi:MAG: hypothetical protein Q7S92_00490 [Candidatus Diapherotrites archaeon]|nr:hypothetical protein [Candidatus Diapherotrites archaeon]
MPPVKPRSFHRINLRLIPATSAKPKIGKPKLRKPWLRGSLEMPADKPKANYKPVNVLGKYVVYREKQGTLKPAHSVSVVEKVYPEKKDQVGRVKKRNMISARREFRAFRSLMQVIPRKYFPTTVRLKLEAKQASSLIFSDLSEHGTRAVVNFENLFQEAIKRHSPFDDKNIAGTGFARSSTEFLGKLNAKFVEIHAIHLQAQKAGWEIPSSAFSVRFNPKTREFDLLITDLSQAKQTKH